MRKDPPTAGASDKPEGGGEWHWKADVPDGARQSGLLYEPGNWGDVLKGVWAVITTRALAARRDEVRYLDPYAGAPTYPLTAATERRLARCGDFAELQRDYVRRGRIASTALLVRDAAGREGSACELQVCDRDAEHRAAWAACTEARVVGAGDGARLLEEVASGEGVPDLVLVDPYDFVTSSSSGTLRSVVALAVRTIVLVYLYNKSPRGGGHARGYESLRRRLAGEIARVGGAPEVLTGRLPADPLLPRAYHEVWLLGDRQSLDLLRLRLAEPTVELATALAAEGAFEEGHGPPLRPESS